MIFKVVKYSWVLKDEFIVWSIGLKKCNILLGYKE